MLEIIIRKRENPEYTRCSKPGCTNKAISEVVSYIGTIVVPFCRKARCQRYAEKEVARLENEQPRNTAGTGLESNRGYSSWDFPTNWNGHSFGCGCEACGGSG